MAEAVSILGEYLKDEPWMELLCNHLRYLPVAYYYRNMGFTWGMSDRKLKREKAIE